MIEPPPVPLHHRTPLTVQFADDNDPPNLEPRNEDYDDDEDEEFLLTQEKEEEGAPGLTYEERKLMEVY